MAAGYGKPGTAGGKGESRAEAFRSTPVVQGNPPTPGPSPCRRGWTPAPCLGGGVPKAGSREEVKVRFQSGLVKAWSLCPREYGNDIHKEFVITGDKLTAQS